MRRAGRASLASHVPERHEHTAVGQRNHIVEVASHGIGRPRHAERLDARGLVGGLRQHGLLNLTRDLQVVLERQAIGDLEEHQEIQEQKPCKQPERARGERRMGDDPQVNGAEELEQPDDRGHQGHTVDCAARGRQLEREGEEQQPRLRECSFMPWEVRERLEVDVLREKPVGLRCVAREHPLELLRGEPLRVGVEERSGAAGRPRKRRRTGIHFHL
jgi:hypothetical protein